VKATAVGSPHIAEAARDDGGDIQTPRRYGNSREHWLTHNRGKQSSVSSTRLTDWSSKAAKRASRRVAETTSFDRRTKGKYYRSLRLSKANVYSGGIKLAHMRQFEARRELNTRHDTASTLLFGEQMSS
jgi:hypothetical protein